MFSKLQPFYICLMLGGCVSFPDNFPPNDSREYLVVPETLTVDNPFNTHYVSKGKYKLMGTIENERFYRPQDATLFSHAQMRYLRIDVDVPNEVCVLYADLVNCIQTSYQVIDESDL